MASVTSLQNRKVRAGIAGAGLMGPWHARAIRKAGGEVVGIADTNETQTGRLVSKFSTSRGFSDVEEMLSEIDLDVLHVCTPVKSHREIAELGIKAGVSLIVEKPLSQTAAETKLLYELADRHRVSLLPVHQFPFQSGVAKAKTFIPKIGQIIHMQASICSAGGAGLDVEERDVIAADILPHPLSLFQSVFNDVLPKENWVVTRPDSGELRIEGLTRGISLSIFVSMNARPTSNSFHIFGTNGTIHLDLFHGFSIVEEGKVSRSRKILHPFDLAIRNSAVATVNLVRRTLDRETAYPGLSSLVHRFYQYLKGNADPVITAEQAINIAEIRDLLIDRAGILESADRQSAAGK